jgi:hypothetical protein
MPSGCGVSIDIWISSPFILRLKLRHFWLAADYSKGNLVQKPLSQLSLSKTVHMKPNILKAVADIIPKEDRIFEVFIIKLYAYFN